MDVSESLILGFVIILGLVALLYVGYFHYTNIKKINEQIEDSSFDITQYKENKKDHKTRNIILNICCYSFLVLSLLLFTGSIILKGNNDVFQINNQYIVQINSDSMAKNEITNNYLSENNIKTKLYVHDIIAFDKVNEKTEFQLMDILLYKGKINNKQCLIAHRLLKINDDCSLILRGDANKINDPIIKKDDVIGLYSHRLEFLSLINYAIHMPSFYATFTFVLIITLSFDISKIYINKQIEKYEVSQ